MKNKLLWAAVASVSLAACSNDEVVSVQQDDSDVVGFRTAMTNTRASEVSAGTLQQTGFWATALKVSDDATVNNTKDWGDTPVHFTWSSTDSKYVSETAHKWSDLGLEFYATNLDPTKHSLTFPTSGNSTDQPKYENFTPARDVADQEDFVYASNEGTRLDFPGTVPLTFNHALSQIEIQAKYAGSDKYIVRCKGYKLVYMYGRNTFDFGEPATTGSQVAENNGTLVKGTWGTGEFINGKPADCWSGFYGGDGYSSLADGTPYYADGVYSDANTNNFITLTSQPKVINGGNGEGTAMLLPQSQIKLGSIQTENLVDKGKGFYIALLVQIDKKKDDGSNTYEPLYPALENLPEGSTDTPSRIAYRGAPKYYGFVSVPVAPTWQPGKKYTYVLDLTDGFGNVDPAGPGTTDPDDSDYNPKDDRGDNPGDNSEDNDGGGSDPFNPGDPVIGSPITFTCTIHDLATGAEEKTL
jgi:hypothetical protein